MVLSLQKNALSYHTYNCGSYKYGVRLVLHALDSLPNHSTCSLEKKVTVNKYKK